MKLVCVNKLTKKKVNMKEIVDYMSVIKDLVDISILTVADEYGLSSFDSRELMEYKILSKCETYIEVQLEELSGDEEFMLNGAGDKNIKIFSYFNKEMTLNYLSKLYGRKFNPDELEVV